MRFRRALDRSNVTEALSAAAELQFVSLVEALELTLLLADGDLEKYNRAALRWHVRFVEETGIVNIANGGATTAETDVAGLATVSLHGASGYGRVVLCADGVPLCRLSVRSPDVNKGATPDLCGIGTGMTAVNGADINNPTCGFLANFGAVTVGVNDGWDLNCDNNVNGSDVTGSLGKGGVLQYFGDTGTLGAKNGCDF